MYGATTYGGTPLGESLAGDSQTRRARGHAPATAAEATRRIDNAYRLPVQGRSGDYLFGVERLRTDHDILSLSGVVSSGGADLLSRYIESDDVTREPTAYGAFRRLSRDSLGTVQVTPPATLSPPLAAREVVAVNASTEPITPTLSRVELELGLAEPRPRDPLSGSGISEELVSETVQVDAGTTKSVTLSGTAPDKAADYLAEAFTPDDSDSQLVAVSDAAFTLAFPAATLRLSREQVGETDEQAEAGKTRRRLPVQLGPSQAADLLAVGARVEASEIREVPDGSNRAVDTLPNSELTASVQTPSEIPYSGDFVLVEWSLSRERPSGRYPYDAELVIVKSA